MPEFKSKFEPKPFTVNGQDFVARRSIPGFMFLEFTKAQLKGSQDANDDQVDPMMGALLYDMFEAVMEPEEFERFRKFANSSDGPDMDTLVEVMQYLTGRDAGRPSEAPVPSPSTAPPSEAT